MAWPGKELKQIQFDMELSFKMFSENIRVNGYKNFLLAASNAHLLFAVTSYVVNNEYIKVLVASDLMRAIR